MCEFSEIWQLLTDKAHNYVWACTAKLYMMLLEFFKVVKPVIEDFLEDDITLLTLYVDYTDV
jgi:hypothetical protein